METYGFTIKIAFMTFPLVALFITFPFLVYEYRKYGSINFLKSAVIYSFILYMITAYLMVILPLPPIESVISKTGPIANLEPFRFLKDIMVTTNYTISNINDLITFLSKSTVYTVLFNIILTIPFGVYLRYLFDKKWYECIFYSFLLSLFFEITQLTGLYGIYPRAYRLFDVDDLMINTLGGTIGYIISPLVTILLPATKELNESSLKKSVKIGIVRRLVAFLLDVLCIEFLKIIMIVILLNTKLYDYSLLITIILYYIIFPILNNNRTLGKSIINIELESESNLMIRSIFRYMIFSLIIIFPFSWLLPLRELISFHSFIYILITIIFIEIINLVIFMIPINGKHQFVHELITKTYNKSSIEIEDIEEQNIK